MIVIKRVTVVMFGVTVEVSGNGGGCFSIEIRVDTAKLTNMIIAGFGDR